MVIENLKNEGGGQVRQELYGPVIIRATRQDYVGAEVKPNNTGELTAILKSLIWLRDYEGTDRPAIIFYDSTYAANIARGRCKNNKNKTRANNTQTLLNSIAKTRNIEFVNVKGHSGNRWNDYADKLANKGASGGNLILANGRQRNKSTKQYALGSMKKESSCRRSGGALNSLIQYTTQLTNTP